MKLRNILFAALSLVAVAAVAVAGTLAYLTSTDSDVNVMTLGNVEIAQHEYQRADGIAHNAGESGKGNGIKKGDLVPFEQGQALYPAVPVNNAATDYTAEATDLFFWGDYVYSGTAGNGLWNDSKLSNVMDKMVFVENTGKYDAYFRTIIAFECPEGITIGEAFQGAEIMTNINGSALYSWEDVGYITVDNVRYAVTVATYQNALNPGNQAHPSLLQVVMTHHATNEDMELLGDTYDILVLSQAVQTEGFADAETALNEGFGEITTTNHPWLDGVVIPTVVSDADAFVEAVNKGGAIVLNGDITLAAPLTVEKAVNIDLNGNDLASVGFELKNGGSIKNGVIKSAGNTENFIFHFLVSGGTLTMDNVDVSITDSFYDDSGFNSSSQACGIRVENAEVVLNNCDVKVHNDTNNVYFVQGWAVDLLDAEFTMNGGSITAKCEKGKADDTVTGLDDPAFACALSADGVSTATLNDVTVTATYFGEVFDWQNYSSQLTFNTTDKNITEDDFILWWSASVTVNHIN